MNGMDYIKIFRGDDSDALGYQTIVGTIKTDLDLTGCRAIFRYLGFFQEFDPIPEDGKLTIVIPAQSSRGFPPGVGYASLKVYDQLGKVRTFTNRIPVIVDAMTPVCPCGGNFEVSFSPFPELEPLKIFVGPGADDFDEYTGFLSKIIDRASLEKYGLTILADAMGEDGGSTGKAASPLAVKAAYDAIIKELTDNYYTAQETDEAIDSLAAYYITSNAAGAAFPTRAALINAQTYYSGGAVRNPTRNDYAVVLADETHDGAEYRYIYAVADGATTGGWQAQYPVGGVMTIDPSVTKNSANPVSSSGIWSAIWGALTAIPSGFTSVYYWIVATFATKADATLTERGDPQTPGFSEWQFGELTYSDPGGDGWSWTFEYPTYSQGMWTAEITNGPDFITMTAAGAEDATTLAFTGSGEGITASGTLTRTAMPGYQLGNDDQHILASEAEAEALRTAVTGKQDALSTQQLANIAAVPSKANASDVDVALSQKQDRYTAWTVTKAVPEAPDATVEWVDGEWKFTYDGVVIGSTDNQNLAATSLEDLVGTYSAIRSVIIDGKANRAANPTAGNLAALDANGNPTDSQIPAADVAVKGNISYDRITITTGQLQDHAVQKVTLNAATTTLSLPALTDLSGKVSDFGIDMVNGYEVSDTPTAASFSLAGTIGTAYNIIVPEGEDWSEMSALAAGEMAQFYFTLSSFQLDSKPTWKVVKQVVQKVTIPTVTP